MEISITNDDRIAIAEVDYIIHHMNERYLNRIPQKIRDCITILKKKNIEIYVDPRMPLENQGLKEFTLHFLMVLNLKYWCSDERRKEILMMMEENQRRFDEKVNNIFGEAESIQSVTSSEIPSSKPKQITVVGNDVNENSNADITQSSNNAIENLKDEEKRILVPATQNIFSKIINKIKSIFIKK